MMRAMDSVRLGAMLFLFALTTFSGLLTQHRGWITAAVIAGLVLGREVGLRSRPLERHG